MGLAHAGVLIGLERHGFQPELVVGTSMGAIIGSLYAAGYVPDSIRAIVQREDWPELFAPARWSFGPQWDGRRPMIRLGMGVDRARYPDGLIADGRVNRLLVHLLFDAGARAGGHFDVLPRHFLAMTAELRAGRPVELSSGDLARAVRASMAVPSVFSPIRWDTL